MILMCVTKSVKPPFLDRDDGIRQQPPSQFQKQTNCLFCIKLLSGNQKEAFRTPYLENTAEATWKIQLKLPLFSRIRHEKSEKGKLSSPTGAKREPNIYVESFGKAAIRVYTVRKHLPTLNTLNSALVRDLSFPGSVETLRKRC